MAAAWIRFVTPEGVVLGLVEVPKTPPLWCQDALAEFSKHSTRKLGIEDLSPVDWVDLHCSVGRPISLYKPLLVRLVEDKLFAKTADLEAATVKDEKGEPTGFDRSKITKIYHGSELQEFADRDEAGALEFIKELSEIPAQILGRQQPKTQRLFPLISYATEDPTSYRLNPASIHFFVEMRNSSKCERQADEAYKETVEAKREEILAHA